MCAEFCCICMVCIWVFISLLGLHSVMLMFVSGIYVWGEIKRGLVFVLECGGCGRFVVGLHFSFSGSSFQGI